MQAGGYLCLVSLTIKRCNLDDYKKIMTLKSCNYVDSKYPPPNDSSDGYKYTSISIKKGVGF